jgi:thiol-disulfide isomerase/thioredoxin
MKFFIIFLLLQFSFISNLFENSKYVKEISSIKEFDSELNKTNITIGMMLIYSVYCGHCHTFSKTYEQLAEKYNSTMLFFAMTVFSDYYKRMPSTWGVPYILYFSDGYFYQHKRRRSFEEISYIIDNFYLTRCKEITYKNIENVYYNVFLKKENIYNNLIIGYFDNDKNIDNFKKTTNLMCQECVGLCYICKDFKENNNPNKTILKYIKNDIIVGYLHNNNSKIFSWENEKSNSSDEQELQEYKNILENNKIDLKDMSPLLYKNYYNFINNDLKLDYYNIDINNKEYSINFLRNKNNLFFSYLNQIEKEKYEYRINELVNITDKNILYFYNLVLFNYNKVKNEHLIFINKSGIYEINQDLNFSYIYNNYEELKNKIIEKYNSSKNYEINYKPLIPEVKEEDRDSFENQTPVVDEEFFGDLFFKILEKVCIVLFTIVITFALFFGLHFKYYREIDQDKLNRIKNRK